MVLLIVYLALTFVVSTFTFGLFAVDKVNASEGDHFRIPERTLLFLSMIGGCFGGLIAMFALRHKSNVFRKNYFRITIYLAAFFWVVTLFLILFLHVFKGA